MQSLRVAKHVTYSRGDTLSTHGYQPPACPHACLLQAGGDSKSQKHHEASAEPITKCMSLLSQALPFPKHALPHFLTVSYFFRARNHRA
eukprot:1159851-Pelagomonas_calceolata.AAC.11